MPQAVNLAISHIQHIGIPVRALDQSVSFYQLLGFNEVMRRSFNQDEGQGTCVMMKKEQILMELYQMPQAVIERDIRKRMDGIIDHIAFDVVDIDHTFNLLKNAGYHLLQSSPVQLDFWDRGCRFFHILGPDGERLEFNQVL